MLRPLNKAHPRPACGHPTQLLRKASRSGIPRHRQTAANPFTGIGNRVNLL